MINKPHMNIVRLRMVSRELGETWEVEAVKKVKASDPEISSVDLTVETLDLESANRIPIGIPCDLIGETNQFGDSHGENLELNFGRYALQRRTYSGGFKVMTSAVLVMHDLRDGS